MLGIANYHAVADRCQLALSEGREAHQSCQPGGGRADLFGVTEAIAHQTTSLAEVLQVTPDSKHRIEFVEAVAWLGLYAFLWAVIILGDGLVDDLEEGPGILFGEGGDGGLHKF